MKRILTVLLALVFTTATLHLSATDEAPSECDYDVNQAYEDCAPIGYGADKAAHTTISMSMVGWGLGLAIAIALIAGILHQSTSTHSDSNTIKRQESLIIVDSLDYLLQHDLQKLAL